MPVCLDWMVEDAVLRNRSQRAKFPANREKYRELEDLGQFGAHSGAEKVRCVNELGVKFPTLANRELIRAFRELFLHIRTITGKSWPVLIRSSLLDGQRTALKGGR